MKKSNIFTFPFLMLILSSVAIAATSDINGDGIVNLLDFANLGSYWGKPNCGSCGGADITGDGNVNIDDLAEVADNWLVYIEPPASPIGVWTFDNGTASDSSGNGHNGTLIGGAKIITDVERGKVLELDGAGDYVNLGNGGWTNPGDHVTIAAWFKVNVFDASYQTIIAKGISTYRLGRTSANNRLAVYMNYASGGSAWQVATGTTAVHVGWHHAAMTYDGTAMKIYIDGVQEDSSTLSTLYTDTANLCIGRNVDSSSRDWHGWIDNVRFYNKALTPAEIAVLAGVTYVIYGTVSDVDSIYDMNSITMSGLPGSPVTDVNGYYTATVDYGWNGTVSPSRTGFTFAPSSRIYSNVTADHNDPYDATVIRHTLSGYVGTLDGVAFEGLPCATATDDYGFYTCQVDYDWSGTAAPEKEGYVFSPTERTYSNVTSDQTSQNYTPIKVIAENPSPADGAIHVSVDQNLSWTAGSLADPVGGQNVYFGTSYDAVNSRDGSVFKGSQNGTSYDPGTLASFKTYYWAIDTVNDEYEGSPWAGAVWSFTTINVDLVGYWRLDEGTGSTATDYSGHGYNGTITGAAWVTDNVMGNVLDFDGVDYITIPSTEPSNAFSSISTQITIALWQYGDAAIQPQNNSIFEGTKNGTNRVLNAHVPWGTGSIFWDAGYASGYDRINKAAVSANQYEGQWNHWAFTKNTSTGLMKIYLNGELWHSGTGMTKSMSGITAFKIGSIADGTSNYDGMICEFRLYKVALSDEQINALVVQSVATEPSPAHKYVDVSTYPTLTWKAGPLAAETGGHDLYLGTNSNLVTTRNASVHIGLLDANSYSPDMLTLATTYYWAVDEVNNLSPASPWLGEVWRFTVRNSTEGYYKDLFIDSGRGLGGYKASGIPAVGLLSYSNEHIDTSDLATTRKIMLAANSGSWIDDNGVLLYPDGEPRFRMYYSNGGDSTAHFNALDPEGTPTMQAYVNHGGSYTGSCAGAWLSGPHKWGVAPTHLETVGLGTTYTDGTIPDGVTSRQIYVSGEWVWKSPLPLSPILRQNYNPAVFNDLKIHGIYQNGGCRTDPARTQYAGNVSWDKERNEALVLFDMTWTLKDVSGAQPRNFLTDPNATETWKMDHNNCMVWSYKGSDISGKVVPCASHPEHRTIYGEETPLQSAIYQYAYSGFGRATVKAAMTSGVARLMNDNATVGHEKIGDKQYHHFTIVVPQGATQLQIVLDGNLYDMNLYARNGDFAFMGEQNVIAATNGTGSDETLTIANPTAGTWYIGVKCNDKVTSTYGGACYTYTSKFELLNGIPYTITATVN